MFLRVWVISRSKTPSVPNKLSNTINYARANPECNIELEEERDRIFTENENRHNLEAQRRRDEVIRSLEDRMTIQLAPPAPITPRPPSGIHCYRRRHTQARGRSSSSTSNSIVNRKRVHPWTSTPTSCGRSSCVPSRNFYTPTQRYIGSSPCTTVADY